jgi:hypothetical protein
MADSDMIQLSQRQLQQLLKRFAQEVDTKGGKVSDADVEKVATKLLNEISPTCELTGSSARERPILNSNVAIKLG